MEDIPVSEPPTPAVSSHTGTCTGTSVTKISKDQKEPKHDESKKAKLDIATGGLAFGSENDVSVHEVKFDDDELQKFEEDFSDIGDFDNTLTDDSHEKLSAKNEFSAGETASYDDVPTETRQRPLDLLDEPPPERNPLRFGDNFAQAYFKAQQEYVPGLGETDDAAGEEDNLFGNPNNPQGLPVNMQVAEQDEGYDEIDLPTGSNVLLPDETTKSVEYWERQRLDGRSVYGHANGEGQETLTGKISYMHLY